MQSQVSSIVRAATRKADERINVLCIPTHERTSSNMAGVNANFYMLKLPDNKGVKTGWNTTFAPIPKNHILVENIPEDVVFDVVLIQHKFGQYQHLKPISINHRIPSIVLEHTTPTWNDNNYTLQLKQMRGDVNLFISDWSRKQWLWTEDEADIIHHGVDTEFWSPDNRERKKEILTVCNDFINRDLPCGYNIWRRITDKLPVKVVGDTPGLSKAAGPNELRNSYREAAVYINPAPLSPIPTSLLEAMSAGCAPVSLAACMVPEIIKHGYNGFISNNEGELRGYCQQLLQDDKLRDSMGAAARQTIIEKFSLDKFVDNWNNILKETADLA